MTFSLVDRLVSVPKLPKLPGRRHHASGLHTVHLRGWRSPGASAADIADMIRPDNWEDLITAINSPVAEIRRHGRATTAAAPTTAAIARNCTGYLPA
jgi:hypothetical protein